MTDGKTLRIAILAHSTNPRGGVVHAIELADALAHLGHEAVVHAPDASGTGFFRAPICPAVAVIASPASSDVPRMVQARIDEYVHHFEMPERREFDVFHAQDAISANALAILKQRGIIGRFARTVHHVDTFHDSRLIDWQNRSIVEADDLFVVSCHWQERLAEDYGRASVCVGNGVDPGRFTPARTDHDRLVRERLGLRGGPTFLSVGGIEERKNSIRILEAFQQLRTIHPDARLVIAGGASLLDHGAYRDSFDRVLASYSCLESHVMRLGPVADADMPALFRLADALAFPSVKEGFGLVVLEAMASGLPVVTSRIAPFTEYLEEHDVIWCDPLNTASIANAMAIAVSHPLHIRLAERGILIARQHNWSRTAKAHLPVYHAMTEMQNA